MIKGLYEAHLPVGNLSISIEFYKRLGLELAYLNERLAFFWIEKGHSWLGFWETEKVETPYHPSLRHIAFQQPLVLPNNPQAHAAIYFDDPDGNSLEFITPLRLDYEEEFPMMALKEWFSAQN